MHELALSQNILEAVAPHVGEGRRLVKVVVECDVGLGIVETSLDFCFSITAEHMGFGGAVLELRVNRAPATCQSCGNETTVDSLWELCPACGHAPLTVNAGRELRVAHIEVQDDSDP